MTKHRIQADTKSSTHIVVDHLPPASDQSMHIVFCCGFHSTMTGNKARFLRSLCADAGWGISCFDYRGLGESDGEVEHFSLHDWLQDTLAVIDALQSKFDVHQPVVLIGSSMGAWLATHACILRPQRIAALVTIAAAPDFTRYLLWPSLKDKEKNALQAGHTIAVSNRYDDVPWKLRQELFASGESLALLSDSPMNTNPSLSNPQQPSFDTHSISCPVRLMHGTADTDVPWQFSMQLMSLFSGSEDVSLQLIKNGDHRLSNETHLKQLADVLASLNHAPDRA